MIFFCFFLFFPSCWGCVGLTVWVRTSFTSRGYALPLYIARYPFSSSVVNFHIPDAEDVRIPFVTYFSVANSVTSTPCRV